MKIIAEVMKQNNAHTDFSFSKLWQHPSRISLDARGFLDLPIDGSNPVTYLQSVLPDLPFTFGKDSINTEHNSRLRLRYKVCVLGYVFPFLKDECLEIETLLDAPEISHGDYETLCSDFIRNKNELGGEIQIVLRAADSFLVTNLTREIQYSGYGLSLAEVVEIEAIDRLRSEINVVQSNFESSDSYFSLSKMEVLTKTEEFDTQRKKVTSMLWTVLHLGANFISAKDKHFLKKQCDDDKILYRTTVEEQVINLRKQELAVYRQDPKNYSLPKSFA
mmetsp:Transcript_24078/g.33136  ORF Transcript_24078/g.33136 Transcript_24078/m.33136 type:complete len:276 (+) Transcript_24078:65-892(+)